MKKSVRIRKAGPGETPGYYNNAAKFLKKAQMGMQVGSVSKDPARLNKIYENAYFSLKNSITPDLVYNELITSYALDQATALSIIKSAVSQLSEEGYFDPAVTQKQEEKAAANNPQGQQQVEEEEQRASDDAEDEELANSSDGYYDDEEALNNDTSHLETEQSQQMGAFGRYGGYMQDGGTSDEYEDFENSQTDSTQKNVMNQYSTPGNLKNKKPFSLEDLMAITPGMQNQEAFPDLSYYVGDYKPVSDSFQPQQYLPQAQDGGVLARLAKQFPLLTQGPGYTKALTPMTNLSTARKMLPLATMTGQAMTKLPYVGAKLTPQLKTTFTQNRDELWKVLHGDATPKPGIFSYNGTVTGGGDGSLGVDRLQLYQDDVFNIIRQLNNGQSSFKLSDLSTVAETDGLLGGVYPLDSKVIGGTDDAGNNFFELTYKFGPNQKLPFGSTSSKAKELTFKNRFYYNMDWETGTPMVFDQMGNPLSQGVKSKSIVTPPALTGLGQGLGDLFLRDRGKTPFPHTGEFPFEAGLDRSMKAPLQGTFSYITEQPPTTYAQLSNRGKVGRGLETYATTGLNQLYRTKAKNIQNVELPTFGYVNPALGPNVIDPAAEGSYAGDIKNALNYKYRIGRNTLLGAGALGYTGYKTWDALYNQCQCDDPLGNNYQPKDKYGNCPCGTDVGPIRTLDPTGVEFNKQIDQKQLTYPDSMQFLIQKGIYPSEYNYYRYKDSSVNNPNVNVEMPADDFKYGGTSKSNFIKAVTARFQEGGQEQTIGKGKRTDDLTNTIENKKSVFKSALKNNSNKAVTGEIYDNAKYNPKIMNLLMQDGYKENLADDMSMQPQAEIGGFVDMDSENPLTRFIYGGNESEYYEPYGLPEAQDGINIMNQAGEKRTVGDKLGYEDWLAGEANQEDYEAANPGSDYNTWYSDFTSDANKSKREGEYKDYESFYNKALNEYLNYGKPESNGGCPAGYEWNGSACVLKKQGNTQTKCGPGTVWNATYKACIPLAKMNYVPRMVRGQGSIANTLLPWNPVMANMGSYAQPMGKPYYLGTKDAFMGQLPPEVAARYVTKKGLLGKEKEWLDIYKVAGDNPIDVSQLKGMVDPEKERRQRSERSDRPDRVGRNEYIDSKLQEDAWNKKHWDELSNAEKRDARTTYAFENEDARRFRDKVRFGAQGTRYNEEKSTKRVREPKQKQFGGPQVQYRNGGFSPFDLGTGFSSGIGQDMSAFAPQSADTQFDYSMFGAPKPSSLPPQQQNPFAFMSGTGTGSYAETANTGHTLGAQGQEIIPQKEPPTPNEYVGVENKRKTMRAVDPEAGVNAFNAAARGVLGTVDRFQNAKKNKNFLLDMADTYNLMGSSTEKDRGDQVDYGSYLGYRTPEQGQDRSSRATFGNYATGRYGGYMESGGFTAPYTEDEEVYMTPEELQQFLAAGGQVEYL